MAAQDRSAEAVRLLLVDARLELAHGRHDKALQRLGMANRLIASRHQTGNPDAYDLEMLSAQAAMQTGNYPNAATHAASAVELARTGAIDGASSAWLGAALLTRAQAEKALGQAAASVADARAALGQLEPNVLPTHPLITAARGIADGGVKANSGMRPGPPSAPR